MTIKSKHHGIVEFFTRGVYLFVRLGGGEYQCCHGGALVGDTVMVRGDYVRAARSWWRAYVRGVK
jgi:hypothetical protein